MRFVRLGRQMLRYAGRGALSVLAAGVSLVPPVFAQEKVYSEYGVKSAFVFNFFKFIELPEQAAASELRLCIVASDNAYREFAPLSGKEIDGRTLETARLTGGDSAWDCDALFVSGESQKHVQPLLRTAKPGLLTIGEHEEFIAAGGIISFFVQDGKIRFEIDADRASKNKIQISSKLLKLGKIAGRTP